LKAPAYPGDHDLETLLLVKVVAAPSLKEKEYQLAVK
jgi:hypothetical protein